MAKHSCRFNSDQIESKIKNLKKTYKIILDNSNKTARGRITWPYFNSLQQIFGKKPENNPLSIASSRSGFEHNSVDTSVDTSATAIHFDSKSHTTGEIPTKMPKFNPEVQPIAGPSHLKENSMTQQHEERMDKQQQFLDLFKEWLLFRTKLIGLRTNKRNS